MIYSRHSPHATTPAAVSPTGSRNRAAPPLVCVALGAVDAVVTVPVTFAAGDAPLAKPPRLGSDSMAT